MKYASLVGKIGVEMSRLLKESDYEELMRAGSVPEIANYLRERSYGDFIPTDVDIHRRDLESFIQKRFYTTLENMEKYLSFPEKKVMEHVSMRCEIEMLKKVLRIFAAGEEFDERFLVCDPGFDPENLLNSRSLEDLISKLSERPYYGILRSTLREGMRTGDLENALDLWYFTRLSKIAAAFGLKSVLRFLRKQLDLMNSMWIYRGKFLLGYEPERILNSILPMGGRITRETVNRLVNSRDEDEFFKILSEAFREDMVPPSQEKVPREFILERRLTRILVDEAKRLVRNYFNGFDMLLGYIHLLEYEIKNIVTIVETVRYKLEPEVGRMYLIGG